MVFVAGFAAVGSAVALAIAVMIGSASFAWTSVGLAVIGLLLLTVGVVKERGRVDTASAQARPVEHHHTAGDELFGEHDVERDIWREERVISPDMLGRNVPYEEELEDIRHAGHGPRKHGAPRVVEAKEGQRPDHRET